MSEDPTQQDLGDVKVETSSSEDIKVELDPTILDVIEIEQALAAKTLPGDDFWPREVAAQYQKANKSLILPAARESEPARQIREDLMEIAKTGSLREKAFAQKGVARGSRWTNEFIRRNTLLAIYSQNPELALFLIGEDVEGLHGATSGALLPVLEEGLKPLEELRREGKQVLGGERQFAGESIRNGTSFVEWHEANGIRNYIGNGEPVTIEGLQAESARLKAQVAGTGIGGPPNPARDLFLENTNKSIQETDALIGYLQAPPKTERDALQHELIRKNFPVIFGVNLNGLDRTKFIHPDSSISSEFVIPGGAPKENLKLILVPRDKTDTVKELVEKNGVNAAVQSIEDMVTF